MVICEIAEKNNLEFLYSLNWGDTRTNVILVSGKAGVGKTTYANMLYNVIESSLKVKSAFALGVKQVASFMGWDRVKDDRGRKLLQDIGNVGREYNKDCWLDLLNNLVMGKFQVPFDYIILDDWRFPSEAEWFERDPQYKVWKVRIEAFDRESLKGTQYYRDISETALDGYKNFDLVFINSEDGFVKMSESVQFLIDTIINNKEN